MRHMFRALPALTRAHFHSLAHHIVAHRVSAVVGGGGEGAAVAHAAPWSSDPAGAAAAGALACAEQACDTSAAAAQEGQFYTLCPSKLGVGDTEVGSGVSSVRRLTLEAPAATWQWALGGNGTGAAAGQAIAFAAVPVPVCAKPTRTVGLGDAVSAAALGADVVVAAA